MNLRNLLTEITAGLLSKCNIRQLFSISYSAAMWSFSLSVLFSVSSLHTTLLCRSFTFYMGECGVHVAGWGGGVVAFKELYHLTVFDSKSPCCLGRGCVSAHAEYHLYSFFFFLISFLYCRDWKVKNIISHFIFL